MRALIKKTAVLAAAFTAFAWAAAAGAGTFQAGAAKVDITPDVNKWKVNSIGYFSQKQMTSVNDPVFCKALVVSDGREKAAIVTCDLMGTPPILRQKVLAEIESDGFNSENLLISCSHTHSGPGNMMPILPARLGFGPYIEELTIWTAHQIARAVKEAQAGMKPAVLKVAEARIEGVTRNRRDPAGSYNYDTRRFTSAYDPDNPENIVDPTLTLLRIDATDGSPIAVLFHFATHGTVLGAENLALSADWPGVSQQIIEQAVPGAVAMYMNGAEGDQAPAMNEGDGISDLEYLQVIGKKIADGVLKNYDRARPVEAVPIRTAMVTRKAPPGNKLLGYRVPKALVRHYFHGLPLQALRLGDVVFMALPVEMVSEAGLAMKNGARGQGVHYPLVAGLANDHLLYAATPDDFEQGGYEVDNTALGETEAGLIIGEQMLLVRKVMGLGQARQ